MSFRRIQGAGTFVAATQNVTLALGVNPTPGNLVVVIVGTSSAANAETNMAVVDSVGNSYTPTPSSPRNVINSVGNSDQVWIYYLLNAPSNASKTITASWVGSGQEFLWLNEFAAAGVISFDVDGVGGVNGVNNTAIATPSITPTFPNSLLIAAAVTNFTMTAPTSGSAAGPWTGASATVGCEYDLDATGATAVNFTQNTSTTWSSMAAAFREKIPDIQMFDLTPGSCITFRNN